MWILLKFKAKITNRLALAVLPILICFTLPAFSQSKTAQKYYDEGKAFYDIDNYDLAIKSFSEAIRIDPNKEDAWYYRGESYRLLKHYDKAITDFSEAIRIDPKDAYNFRGRGNSYHQLKQYDKTITDLSEAIRINPKDADNFRIRGNSYYELKQYDKAITDYSESIGIDPNKEDAWYYRGISYSKLNQFDKAITDLSEAIRIDPKDAFNFRSRGSSYYASAQYDKALPDYSEAIRLDSKNANSWYDRGLSHFMMGAKNLALADYTEAYRLNPDFSHVNLKEKIDELSQSINNQVVAQNTVIANVPAESYKDIKAPMITILSPIVSRGLKVVQKNKTVVIRGKVTDESGIYEVTVNGSEASVDASGNFSSNVLLGVGVNKISVVATDVKMNKGQYDFEINREAETIIQPVETPIIAVNNSEINTIGKYYALIIGIQDYQDETINDLDRPVADASSLYQLLTSSYTFEKQDVSLLKNPTREQLFESLEFLSKRVKPTDNLLIFYAGHGYWDENRSQGYWFPSDARQTSRSTWLTNADLKEYISAIDSKHTLLISDACFSGGIFKSRSVLAGASRAVKELYDLPSRKAMTSGTLKEVPDQSVFIEYLAKRLNQNAEKYLSAERLYSSLRDAVINNSANGQVPQFGEIREAGDEGGDFIFIRR